MYARQHSLKCNEFDLKMDNEQEKIELFWVLQTKNKGRRRKTDYFEDRRNLLKLP